MTRSELMAAAAAVAALGWSASAASQAPASPPPSPAETAHVEAARRIGGSDLATSAKLLCLPSRQTIAFMQADAAANPPEQPAKVFDNLYFVGGRSVTSWAIKTSEGIILIDALSNEADAKAYIIAGMQKLGLDPKDIKYVFIAHAHGDHYGGAKLLQDTYGAQVVASEADWAGMAAAGAASGGNPNWGPPPRKQLVVKDGEQFTLGDTTLTVVHTPGHTPGTISFIIPVKDKGVAHQAALWGGTGQPAAGPASDQYERSLEYFAQFTRAAKVDVALSNHPLVDGTIERLTTLKAGRTATNPFVIGEEAYGRYMAIHKECLLAARARPPQQRPGA